MFNMPNLILSNDELQNNVLYELEQLFNASNSFLIEHNIPLPDSHLISTITNKAMREELNYDFQLLEQQHYLFLSQLNKEQKEIYDCVVGTIK